MESYPGVWSKSLHSPPPLHTPTPLHFVPFSAGRRSGPGPAGPDQTGPQGRCGCCPCCGLCSGPRCSARACGGAPASATLSTGTPLTPGSTAERGERQAGPARSQAVRVPAARLFARRCLSPAQPRDGAPLFEPAGEGRGVPGVPPPARTCWGGGRGTLPEGGRSESESRELRGPGPVFQVPPPFSREPKPPAGRSRVRPLRTREGSLP